MLGKNASIFRGKTLPTDVVHPEDLQQLQQLKKSVREQKEVSCVLRIEIELFDVITFVCM